MGKMMLITVASKPYNICALDTCQCVTSSGSQQEFSKIVLFAL